VSPYKSDGHGSVLAGCSARHLPSVSVCQRAWGKRLLSDLTPDSKTSRIGPDANLLSRTHGGRATGRNIYIIIICTDGVSEKRQLCTDCESRASVRCTWPIIIDRPQKQQTTVDGCAAAILAAARPANYSRTANKT
jgi:hypothetical protein